MEKWKKQFEKRMSELELKNYKVADIKTRDYIDEEDQGVEFAAYLTDKKDFPLLVYNFTFNALGSDEAFIKLLESMVDALVDDDKHNRL